MLRVLFGVVRVGVDRMLVHREEREPGAVRLADRPPRPMFQDLARRELLEVASVGHRLPPQPDRRDQRVGDATALELVVEGRGEELRGVTIVALDGELGRVAVAAVRLFEAIADRRIREQLRNRIDGLAHDPERQGKPMREELAGWRSLRAVGQRYRIIYRVDRHRVLVIVVAVGLRKEGDRQDIYRLAQKLVRLGLA